MQPHVPAPRRRAPGWIELSVALAAVVVSAASLYIARQQTNVMSRQLAASVWPAVQLYSSNLRDDGEPTITLSMTNVGIGPARIHTFRVFHDDEPITDILEFLRDCCGAPDLPIRTITSFVEGRILTAGEAVDYLILPGATNDPALFQRFNQVRNELEYELCYCSVMDDCWALGRGERDPASVPSCRAAD